jgi:hypothetical protein
MSARLVEDEEPEQCEDFSQRLKESVIEDKKFWKDLVDQCQYVQMLVDLCAQLREDNELATNRYVKCFEVSTWKELAKAYFRVKTLCASI